MMPAGAARTATNGDTMVITWDLNHEGYAGEDSRIHYKEGAVYDYVITGFTPDGTSVQIDAGSYTTRRTRKTASHMTRLPGIIRMWQSASAGTVKERKGNDDGISVNQPQQSIS